MNILQRFKLRKVRKHSEEYPLYKIKKPCGAYVVEMQPCDYIKWYDCRYCEIWVPGPRIRKRELNSSDNENKKEGTEF